MATYRNRYFPKWNRGFLTPPEKIESTIHQGDFRAYFSSKDRKPNQDHDWVNLKQPFMETELFLGLQQRFVEGLPWKDTVYHELMCRGFLTERYIDLSDPDRAYEPYDRLFEKISKKGYDNSAFKKPVLVHGGIGRELIRHDGSHRLAIALLLKIPEIRVAYKLIHKDHVPPENLIARHVVWRAKRKQNRLRRKDTAR